jgi:plastocyanin
MVKVVATAVLSGLVLVPAAIPASQSTAAVRISVSARGSRPKLAHARVGEAVTWTNTTALTHRITPIRGGFRSFVLRAHADHTARFKRPGRYPYRVDGRAGAVVVVLAGSTSPKLLRTWTGTFSSDAASDGGAGYQACSTTWSGTIHFTATSSGVASGAGTADEVAGTAKCALYVDPERINHVEFTVHGAVTVSDLSLTFTIVRFTGGVGGDGSGFVTHVAYQPTIEVQIEKGHARGTADFSYPFGNGGTITAHDRLDLAGS